MILPDNLTLVTLSLLEDEVWNVEQVLCPRILLSSQEFVHVGHQADVDLLKDENKDTKSYFLTFRT